MKVPAPKLPAILDDAVDVSIEADASFEGCRITTTLPPELVASSVNFDECTLARLHLGSVKMPKITMRDCIVQGGDYSAALLSEGGLQRVSFRDARMTGVDFSRTTIKDVSFKSCKLDMSNVRFAKLTNVLFEDCALTDADFQNATLKNVRFKNCHMERTAFFAITALNVDIRGSLLLDIRGWQDAKGFVIDSTQLVSVAPQLALALSITVSDD